MLRLERRARVQWRWCVSEMRKLRRRRLRRWLRSRRLLQNVQHQRSQKRSRRLIQRQVKSLLLNRDLSYLNQLKLWRSRKRTRDPYLHPRRQRKRSRSQNWKQRIRLQKPHRASPRPKMWKLRQSQGQNPPLPNRWRQLTNLMQNPPKPHLCLSSRSQLHKLR